ncbi:Tryptophan-rich sensory protein [Carnimonas sp. R-84981]|uniref:TspO/MBR family protein n=1 Tax=Carnimonas bestiolae TaxID=3402172 RepID=UPI003EDC4DA4
MRKWLLLIGFLVVVVGGGLLLGYTTRPDSWFNALHKPAFNPPPWVFAPVWSVIYALIAVAGWRVWMRTGWSSAMRAWMLQLALNFCWSPVFFGVKSLSGGAVIIVAMLLAIVLFMVRAQRVDKGALLLFVPYLAWVAYATLLNISLVMLN